MKKKTTWMRYLTLGIIISLSILINACKKEYFRVGHFYFINQTAHTITYDNLFQEYNLAPNQILLI